MQSAGKVMRFSSTGTLIIRSDVAPQIGLAVCDMRGRDIGRIIRITGPVNRPYTIVKPLKDIPEGINRLIGKEVYISRPVERQRQAASAHRDERKFPRKDQAQYHKGPGKKSKGGPNRKPDRRRTWGPRD